MALTVTETVFHQGLLALRVAPGLRDPAGGAGGQPEVRRGAPVTLERALGPAGDVDVVVRAVDPPGAGQRDRVAAGEGRGELVGVTLDLLGHLDRAQTEQVEDVRLDGVPGAHGDLSAVGIQDREVGASVVVGILGEGAHGTGGQVVHLPGLVGDVEEPLVVVHHTGAGVLEVAGQQDPELVVGPGVAGTDGLLGDQDRADGVVVGEHHGVDVPSVVVRAQGELGGGAVLRAALGAVLGHHVRGGSGRPVVRLRHRALSAHRQAGELLLLVAVEAEGAIVRGQGERVVRRV